MISITTMFLIDSKYMYWVLNCEFLNKYFWNFLTTLFPFFWPGVTRYYSSSLQGTVVDKNNYD